jgi:hypothetical protein
MTGFSLMTLLRPLIDCFLWVPRRAFGAKMPLLEVF